MLIFFSYHFMFALLQFFGALFFMNQLKIVNRSSLLLWEVISASESLRELAKGWSCWNPGLWLAFPTLLFAAVRAVRLSLLWAWSELNFKPVLFLIFSASECLCDDKQRTSTKHCCLQTSVGHHARTGNSCCLSGKGRTSTKAWLLSLLYFANKTSQRRNQ